jgi:hypothetical protein
VAKRQVIATLLAFALGATTTTASYAEIDKQSCIAAYDQGQRAKLSGELLHARVALAVCAGEGCAESFRSECAQWLDDVNRAMPSVVISVRGKDGNDKTHVRVFADGKLIAEHLDGKAIEMDPGEHDFLFEAAGEDIPEQHVLVMEGQKARPIVASARVPVLASVVTRPMPVAGWVSGGLTVASLVTFGVFAGAGLNDYSRLPPCKCGAGESWNKTEFLIADIALGAVVTAALVTAVIFFTRPTKRLDNIALLPQLRF